MEGREDKLILKSLKSKVKRQKGGKAKLEIRNRAIQGGGA